VILANAYGCVQLCEMALQIRHACGGPPLL